MSALSRGLSLRPCHARVALLRSSPVTSTTLRHITRSNGAGSGEPSSSTAPVNVLAKLSSASYLKQAAQRYRAGLAAGIDEEELLAYELGVQSPESMTPLQQQYKDKIRQKLEKRAEELKQEEADTELRLAYNFVLGKARYARGEYAEAVVSLEQAVRDVGPDTTLGGEAQLWLAMAYQACLRDDDAIELYKSIEEFHPVRQIQKKAYDLRYIAEAPKLPLGEDERVKIPLLQSDTGRRKTTFTPKYTPNFIKAPAAKPQTYWDRMDWRMPSGVKVVPDEWYLRVAWLLLAVGTTVYLNWALLPAPSA